MALHEKKIILGMILLSILWLIALLPLLYVGLFLFGGNSLFQGKILHIGLGLLLLISYLLSLCSVPIFWIAWVKKFNRDKIPLIAILLFAQFFILVLLFAKR